MKKLLFPLLFLLIAVTGISQGFINVSGTITDISNGQPIPNQQVIIHNDSNAGIGYFYQTTYTNNAGYYNDTIPLNGITQGNLYVKTFDCQNYMHLQSFVYSPAQTFFTADFNICYNSNPCQANFTPMQNQPLTVEFYDASVGGGNLRAWDFGDGTTSSLLNPVHTYQQAGTYVVTLTIGALGTTCYNSTSMTITVWGNNIGCQANFIAFPDSMMMNMYYFINQSTGNIQTYSWDFGDGTTSSQMSPTHTYNSPGAYNVCLTVQGDSSCFDTYCQTIWVQTGGDCQAAFNIIADSNAMNSFYFINQSIGNNITTYTWNFNDGTPPVTIVPPNNPNVHHTFPGPGYYMVCLTIHDDNNTCFDTDCDTLIIGTPPTCVANFYFFPDSANLPTMYYFGDLSLGNINSWAWNFGDPASGANNTSSFQSASHNFSGPGTYTVCLTVTGTDSLCHDTFCATVVVYGGPGCQANFDYTLVSSTKTASFTDLSTGSPTSWFWSFGDGTSSTEQNPVHTFAAAGVYDVTLLITGANCQSTVVKPVTIIDSTNYQHIYGQVFAGNFPITQGMAMIFPADTNPANSGYFAVAPLDSNGVYYFNMVPEGSYYILAIPLETSGYLPTYFGNSIYWEQSTIVILGTAANPYNINLFATEQLITGNGSISGQIGTGDFSAGMLDKINMILKNEQGQAIGFVHVTAAGDFDFPSLALGTYYLRAEMPGVTSDQITVTLTEAQPHAEIVLTYSGNSILGINDQPSIVDSYRVYPNPVRDAFNIELSVKSDASATIEILNFTGRSVQKISSDLSSGGNAIRLQTASLPEGIYMYRITAPEGINLTGKLVKTR